MSGINTNASSLLEQAYAGLKKSIKEGTAQVVRGEQINATPADKARAEQNYQNNVRALEQQKADYRTATARTSIDQKNGSASLPDVVTLSKGEAKSMLSGIRQMEFVGDLDGKTISASNGRLNTDSLATYLQWLQAKAGIDLYA